MGHKGGPCLIQEECNVLQQHGKRHLKRHHKADLAIVELHKSEGISQSFMQLVSQSVSKKKLFFKIRSNFLKHFMSILKPIWA